MTDKTCPYSPTCKGHDPGLRPPEGGHYDCVGPSGISFDPCDGLGPEPTWSQAIADWQLHTFGPCDPVRAWSRFEEELEELIDADCPPSEPDAKLADEAADVVITLVAWLKSRTGLDLAEAVERKMQVNRARKWDVRGDGTGYHVKPGDPERTGGAE